MTVTPGLPNVLLLTCLARADVLSRLLGNLVVKNKHAQFVVTQKFLLLQYGYTVRAALNSCPSQGADLVALRLILWTVSVLCLSVLGGTNTDSALGFPCFISSFM